MSNELELTQRSICERYGARFFGCDLRLNVGMAKNVLEGVLPINGVRVHPEDGTSGWFFWGGEEMSDAADFFMPLHGNAPRDLAPAVMPFLALPPGWRFLLAPGDQDVWRDNEDP